MDYDTHTLIELKTMCKQRGLRVSGSKAEVVIRLMEDDESKLPESIEISSNPPSNQQQNITKVYVTEYNSSLPAFLGIFIVLYGLFRMGYSFLWNWETPTHSIIGICIGLAFVFGGSLVVQGYKVGLKITLGILLLSGALSLIFIDIETPLSVGFGEEGMTGLSLMCSGMCMIIVAGPLFSSNYHFREGKPNYLNHFIDALDVISPVPFWFGDSEVSKNEREVKIVTSCSHCSQQLRIPEGYKGKAKCPACNEITEFE